MDTEGTTCEIYSGRAGNRGENCMSKMSGILLEALALEDMNGRFILDNGCGCVDLHGYGWRSYM